MYDVIVLGLGGMGSAAAYHLAARGKRVLGLEKFGAAHDQGSSHGDSRIIRQAYHEDPAYVPLARSAYELWERLERDSQTSILQRTGGLMIGSPESGVVKGALLSAKQFDLPFEVFEAGELRRRYPVLNPGPRDIGVYEAVAGYLRPEIAIRAHLELAARHGAELHFEEAVTWWSVQESGDRVLVKTGTAAYEAARLVLAAGAWTPEILAGVRIPFDVRRHVMCWFQPLASREKFQPDQFPIYIWEVEEDQIFYGFPATGGAQDGVKVGIHSGGQSCTAETIHRDVDETDVDEIRAYLERLIPSLNGPLQRATTCMYTLTPDEHFVVSVHPLYPQVSIAAGFSGHGFKFTSVMGEILADLAIDGKTDHPIEFLSPGRFGLIRSA